MRILIDATSLSDQFKFRGIGSYTRELILRIMHDRSIEWHLIGFNDLMLPDELRHVQIHSIGPVYPSSVKNVITFRRDFLPIINQVEPDLYFAPNAERGVPGNSIKTVVTIHDLIPLQTSSYSQKSFLHNVAKGFFYRFQLRRILQADHFLTHASFTKNEMIEFGVDQSKIDVVHLGVRGTFKAENIAPDNVAKIKKDFRLSASYILYYGGLEANKNVSQLLEIFKKFSTNHPDYRLVIVTPDLLQEEQNIKGITRYASEIAEQIQTLNISEKVIIIPTQPEEKLAALMKGARVFAHLSKYEGFGLSVAEALAAGTPAFIADASCYPELFSGAAIMVNPDDFSTAVRKLEQICNDKEYREKVIASGLRRAEEYSWERSAENTLEILKKLL